MASVTVQDSHPKSNTVCTTALQNIPKMRGVSTFSGEKLGKLAPFAAGPPEVGTQGPPVRVSTRFLSSQVPERAHTLCGCTINCKDLLISLMDFVGCVSAPLGNPAPDAGG